MKANEKALLIKEIKEVIDQVEHIKNRYKLEPFIELGLVGVKYDLTRVISNLETQEQEVEIEVEC